MDESGQPDRSKSASPKPKKRSNCPKGTRRNKQGDCVEYKPKSKTKKVEKSKSKSKELVDSDFTSTSASSVSRKSTSPKQKTKKRRNCPKGTRRNKQGDCIEHKPKEEKAKELSVKELSVKELSVNNLSVNNLSGLKLSSDTDLSESKSDLSKSDSQSQMVESMGAKGKKMELFLGDIIQINDASPMYYINYIDLNQIDVIDITTLVERTFRLDNGRFNPEDDVREITLIYHNPLRGFVKQHHFKLNMWLNIMFTDNSDFLNVQITDIKNDMIQVHDDNSGDYYYINFKYQGIPKTSNIKSIKKLPDPDPTPKKKPIVQEEATSIAAATRNFDKIVVLKGDDDDDDPAELDLDLFDPDADISPSKEDIEKEDIEENKEDEEDDDEIDFIGDFPEPLEKISYNRFGIQTQTNDILNSHLVRIPEDKRTAYAINKIHTLITRFKQLREQSSVFDLNGFIYDVVRNSSLFKKPLLNYLSKYQNTKQWMYLVSSNEKKWFVDEDELNADNNDGEEDDNLYPNKYLTEFEELQKNSHKDSTLQDLNLMLTPFYNKKSDHKIFAPANALMVAKLTLKLLVRTAS